MLEPTLNNSSLERPDALLVALETILEPLKAERLFARAQPLEVELGSGDGSFLVERARRHPEINFIGVERLLGRLRKVDRKGRRAGLTNLRGVQIECSYFLQYLLPPESCQAVHLYFPDPWPKRKQRKHRLVNESFPGMLRRILLPDAVIYLRTDDAHYFAQMREVFQAAHFFREKPTPPELLEFKTDFEREFNAKGIATRHAAFQRIE